MLANELAVTTQIDRNGYEITAEKGAVVLNFGSSPVRHYSVVFNGVEQLVYVAAEVCAALGIAEGSEAGRSIALSRLQPEGRTTMKVEGVGGLRDRVVLTSGGVFELSRKAKTEASKQRGNSLTMNSSLRS